MGWGSGCGLFSNVITVIQSNIEDFDTRKSIYEGLMKAFEDFDCDTLDECYGVDPAFDKLWDELYQEEDEDNVYGHFGQD